MNASVSIPYDDWKNMADDNATLRTRIGQLEGTIKVMVGTLELSVSIVECGEAMNKAIRIGRRALEPK